MSRLGWSLLLAGSRGGTSQQLCFAEVKVAMPGIVCVCVCVCVCVHGELEGSLQQEGCRVVAMGLGGGGGGKRREKEGGQLDVAGRWGMRLGRVQGREENSLTGRLACCACLYVLQVFRSRERTERKGY